jgi:hypothetical protein
MNLSIYVGFTRVNRIKVEAQLIGGVGIPLDNITKTNNNKSNESTGYILCQSNTTCYEGILKQ